MRIYYIKKNELFLKVETVTSESDYWEVSKIVAEHQLVILGLIIKMKLRALRPIKIAESFLAKKYKQSFFFQAEVI